MLAVNLLRGDLRGALRIILIERGQQIGRGLAYSHAPYPYLLNVPASRMSASPANPTEFYDFARSRNAEYGSDDFLPRDLYGEYLEGLLHKARAESTAELRIVCGEVLAITGGSGQPFDLNLRGAPSINADQVVLCIGAPPAAPVCVLEPSAKTQNHVGFAYESHLDLTGAQEILLLGTGLTMADIAIAADAQNPTVVVHALSRHGLLPKAQTLGPPVPVNLFDIDALPDTSLRTIFRLSRRLAEEVARHGGDWRDVVVSLRGIASRLWARWTEKERRRFLVHLRVYWDIYRHRLPPQTMAHLQRMRDANRLRVYAGHLRRLRSEGTRIQADWIARSGAQPFTGEFDRVINCTGSNCPLDRWNDPLVQMLRAQGFISADGLGLGLSTGKNGVVIGMNGKPMDELHYLGPMLRADHWEATATTELRHHATNLARHLLQWRRP